MLGWEIALLQGLYCQDRTTGPKSLPSALSRLSISAETVYIFTLYIGQTIRCGDWTTDWTTKEPCGSIPSRGTRLFSTLKQISTHCSLGAPRFVKISSATVILNARVPILPVFLDRFGWRSVWKLGTWRGSALVSVCRFTWRWRLLDSIL